MKISHFAIMAGTPECNAGCPWCIAKVEPAPERIAEVNEEAFRDALDVVANYKSDRAAVTFSSQGETTLYPGQITRYLHMMKAIRFDRIMLQTNGTNFEMAALWRGLGLTHVDISIAHYDKEQNAQLMQHKPNFDFWRAVSNFRQHKLKIGLACVLIEGGIDTIKKVDVVLKQAAQNGVDSVMFFEPQTTSCIKGTTLLPNVVKFIEAKHPVGLANLIWRHRTGNERSGLIGIHIDSHTETGILPIPQVNMSKNRVDAPSGVRIQQVTYWPNGDLMYVW